jgi:hypothetical protein
MVSRCGFGYRVLRVSSRRSRRSIPVTEQGPAIADRTPIFALFGANAISQVGNMMTAVAVRREDHASVMDSLYELYIDLRSLCEGLLTISAMERVQRTLLTFRRWAIHPK